MPRIRGKFKVIEVTQWSFNRNAAYVKLESVADDVSPEDALSISGRAANISIMVTKPALVECFPVGKYFEVDFTPVEAPAE